MLRLGILMDPIGSIKIKKDSSFAMLLAAQKRGWELLYMEQPDLFLRDGRVYAHLRTLRVNDDPKDWFELDAPHTEALERLDILLMRKDPPFDMEYIYTTHLLDRAAAEGVLVANNPASLRDCNEKLYTAWFPDCCAPTLVTRNAAQFREFLAEHGDIVMKPLHGMGGASIFRVRADDPNTGVILETLTEHGSRFAMAQRFIPEISAGDKRILMIDGEPVPYALARIPAHGESRGNLAAGGRGEGAELSARDRWICEQVGPALRERGLYFVGLDVIGDYLTEINVTSPTCIRELDKIYGLDIAGQLMDSLAARRAATRS
ncbi:MAG: glutathione synthase [Gammaproteobacteria bacterium]|nr:glutathione synthase [Gammaproteobacteria bacterium]